MPVLIKLFNAILSQGIYPKAWGEGIITSIYKKGQRTDPANYRGITLSNSLAKVFGLVLRQRLTTFCEVENTIDERQSSHRKKSRTIDNVFVLRALFDKYCNVQKQTLYVAFIDFKKAFDSVWHEALFLKLRKAGVCGKFYNIIKNMYQSISCTVKYDNSRQSRDFHVERGVRQGDVLSPLLFNTFVNDIIPLLQEESNAPPKLIDTAIGCLLYADDLMVLSTTEEGIQNSLNKLHSFCLTWKLEVSLDKSKIMCFHKTGKTKKKNFMLGNEELKYTDSYTYLGVELSKSGSSKLADQALHKRAMRAWFKMKKLISGAGLMPRTILKMLDQLVKPIAIYGAEIWGVDLLKL